MLFEYPLAMLLHKFPAPTYLGFFIFAWGICLVMANFCVSFTGLMIARFVLGALESVIAPCFLVITGMYSRACDILHQLTLQHIGTPLKSNQSDRCSIFWARLSLEFSIAYWPMPSEIHILMWHRGACSTFY